jgi:hypothetical protein
MATKRYLLAYLPPYVQEYAEVREALNALQHEIDDGWKALEDVLNDFFIMSATENGVIRYERMMKITPKDTDTLDERKFRILTKMNQELPYTLTKLKESLTTLCGAGNFYIDLQPANYHIEIKLALSNKNNYGEVVDLLAKMIPANLTSHVQIMYNSHVVLSEFTHAELANYTHTTLRNEVINNG